MNRRENSRLLVPLLTLLVAMAGPAVAGQVEASRDRNYGSGATHRSLEWRQPEGGGKAVGLFLADMAPAGMITRILVQDPDGRPIRITQTIDASGGVETGELLDEDTGWWARLELRLGVRADHLGGYFAAAEMLSATPAPPKVRLRFVAAGASPVEAELALAEPAVLRAALAAALAASGAGGEMVAHLPQGLAEAVLFLDSSLSPSPLPIHAEGDNLAYASRGVVEVLAHLLRAAPREGLDVGRYSTPWPLGVGPFEKGTSSSDPAVLELVSRFASVENADPLADYR